MTSTATKRSLQPAGVPATFYPQGLEVTGAQKLVFVSGQIGTDDDGSWPEGVQDQARLVIARVSAVLAEAGLGLADVVKLSIYLTDPADYEPFLAVAGELIGQPRFTVTGLVVSFLSDPAQKVEIEAIAAA
jgi:2-iminobutanoate/2-iminopropanoate deaminase